MSDRYPGGFIKAVPDEPTEYSAVGIWTLEQAAVYKKAGKWPLSADPYFKETTLLLHGDGSGQELCFEDNSSNDFPITVNGDAYGTPFSPYNTSWSNYFDGSGDYISVPDSTDFTMGNGDFTIQAWVYSTRSGSTEFIAGNSNSAGQGSSTAFQLEKISDKVRIFVYAGGNVTVASTADCPLNQWFHVAAVRDGTNLRLYINGVEANSPANLSTTSLADSADPVAVGRTGSYNASYFQGYVSNFSVIKGTCLYPNGTTFTPPSSPLSTSTSGQSVLLCTTNRFIDTNTATTAKTVTVGGNTAVKSLSPFAETDTTTGSGYFDGTGDELTVPNNADLYFGTGQFCVEAWVYRTTVGGAYDAIASMYSGGSNGWLFNLNATGTYLEMWVNPGVGPAVTGATTPIIPGTWFHCVATRDSGNRVRLFVNGKLENSAIDSTNCTDTAVMKIGNHGGFTRHWDGYIQGVRINKGSIPTDYQTSSTTNGAQIFTPPTESLTTTSQGASNTTFLACQYRNAVRNVGFIDSSPNKFLITRNGNTTQGTFSPFSNADGEWSGYFSGGSTSYIETDATTLFDQNAAATFQCWIYPTQFLTSTSTVRRMYIFVKGVIYAGLSIHSDGTLGWYGYPSGSIITASPSGTIVTNEWQHIAIIVDPTSNYIKLYKNGVEVGTSAYSAYGTNGAALRIGIGDTGQSGTDAFIGYMSNVKVSASVATLDYASPPVPSTTSGAGLLTLQANRFYDASGNRTVTPYAAVSVQPFSPFAPSAAYDVSVNGGSGYFDGSGDELTLSTTTAAQIGSGDFSFECFVYPLKSTNTYAQGLISYGIVGNTGGSDYASLQISPTGYLNFFYAQVSGVTLADPTLLPLNQFNHVAVCRSGSTLSMFVNGTRVATTTTSATVGASGNRITIGGQWYGNDAGRQLQGYLSNARIVKGSSAYDATQTTITVPTEPLTAISGTSLLCNFTNAGIFDNTAKNDLETVGNAQVDTSVVKYGQGSMKFDGTGDYLLFPNDVNTKNSVFFGSGDMTIEAWVYPTNLSTGVPTIVDYRPSSGYGTPAFTFWYNGAVSFFAGAYGSGAPVVQGGSLSLNTWSHVAVCRASGTTRIFVNGTQTATSTNAWNQTYGSTERLGIGATTVGTSNFWFGYIDDLRITNGVARYTTDFTPPGGPFLNK